VLRAGRRKNIIHGLVELDVTEPLATVVAAPGAGARRSTVAPSKAQPELRRTGFTTSFL
jgi:hypothetical protein